MADESVENRVGSRDDFSKSQQSEAQGNTSILAPTICMKNVTPWSQYNDDLAGGLSVSLPSCLSCLYHSLLANVNPILALL